MKRLIFIIASFFMLATHVLSAQNHVSDTIEVKAIQTGDSISFQLKVFPVETQLTFLMQGLNIRILQPDTLTVSFPSAAMVRSKVRRHPNEVKAVLEKQKKQRIGQDSVNHVVRPDVQPLVAALNDTTANIYCQNNRLSTHNYKIDLDRQNAIITFSFKLHNNCVSSIDGMANLFIFSAPLGKADRAEFAGRQLSNEKSPHPNGLGEGIRKEDVSKRTFKKNVVVKIVKVYEE